MPSPSIDVSENKSGANTLFSIQNFLKIHHPGRFKVYNLCTEQIYEASAFGGEQSTSEYPIQKGNACSLLQIYDFCIDAEKFMSRIPDRIIVVHSTDGRSRCGMMISCLLVHLTFCRSTTEAIAKVGEANECDMYNYLTPSQQRYIQYYERLLKEYVWESKIFPFNASRTLESISLTSVKALRLDSDKHVLHVIISDSRSTKILFNSQNPGCKALVDDDRYIWTTNLDLVGDCLFKFVWQHNGECFFSCWLNIYLTCETESSSKLKFRKCELDHFENFNGNSGETNNSELKAQVDEIDCEFHFSQKNDDRTTNTRRPIGFQRSSGLNTCNPCNLNNQNDDYLSIGTDSDRDGLSAWPLPWQYSERFAYADLPIPEAKYL